MLHAHCGKEIPSKTKSDQFCKCGCGRHTYIVTHTHNKLGLIKGEPAPYLPGHAMRGCPYDIDPITGCHVWKRNKTVTGYGLVGLKGKDGRSTSTTAHRYMYEEKHGPLPKDIELDHKCRNRACVNLEHLEEVSHLENVRRSPKCVASPQIAYEIRLLYGTGKFGQHELAQMYDISRGVVCSILLDQTWKVDAS